MNRIFAMTTAAALALTGAALAQEDGKVDQRAADAGILSEDGEMVEPGPSPDATATLDTSAVSLNEEDAMTQARNEFSTADADGDDAVTEEEFVLALSAAADENGAAAVSVDTESGMTDATVADAGASSEAGVQDGDMSVADYLAAKFAMISGDDATLTLEEMVDARRADFGDADINDDAILEGDEIETFAALKSGRGIY